MRRALSIITAAFFLAGCGTYAPSPFTAIPTATRTATATASPTPPPTATPTQTVTASPTSTPSPSATATTTPTQTPLPPPTLTSPPPTQAPFVPDGSGDTARGDELFHKGSGSAPACINCHADSQSAFSLGPSLVGVAGRAALRPGYGSAEDYLHRSIVEPGAYLVSGFRNIMYSNYAADLTAQEIEDIIAYLMTR